MKVEVFTGNATHFSKPVFSNAPKVFNTVYVSSSIGKNILAMRYSIVLFVASIYKSVVGFLKVQLRNLIGSDLLENNGLLESLTILVNGHVYTIRD